MSKNSVQPTVVGLDALYESFHALSIDQKSEFLARILGGSGFSITFTTVDGVDERLRSISGMDHQTLATLTRAIADRISLLSNENLGE